MDARTLIDNLAELQRLTARAGSHTPEQKISATRVRGQIPAPFLAHFDRLTTAGRKAVAEVRNGVCSGCHLRLPSTLAVRSGAGLDLQICEECGAYLVPANTVENAALASAKA